MTENSEQGTVEEITDYRITPLMNAPTPEIQTRKADHLRICLEEDVQFSQITTGFDRYRFTHSCLPDLDYADLDVTTEFLGKSLGAPLLISSMTGGTEVAKRVNFALAKLAQRYGLAMGVGSGRVAIEHPQLTETFQVRPVAPDILLLANLGAVQLNYGYGVAECQRVVDELEADALILHLNPLQECIQARGDRNFKELLPKIAQVCDRLSVPVIVKEVGNGISAYCTQQLVAAGVRVIDVAGAGGTSWAKVESERAENSLQRRLGQTFGDWGIPTAECLIAIRAQYSSLPLIASGGLRTGLDAAKAIALGADLVGLAFPFLQAASMGEMALAELAAVLIDELKTVLFCTGTPNLSTLKHSQVLQKVR